MNLKLNNITFGNLVVQLKKKSSAFWVKSLIFLLVAVLLYFILKENKNLDKEYLAELQKGWQEHGWLLMLSILLIPANWSLEAYKWKYLIGQIEQISFGRALEGVVTGVTMGFVTPHSLGDYAARILTLTNAERLKGIGAVFMSRISQFYITLYFGSVSIVFYVYKVIRTGELNYQLIVWFTVLTNITFILVFIYHKPILRYLERIKLFHKLLSYFEVIQNYSFRELNFVLGLSLLRYLVFCLQFMLVLIYFGITLPWWLLLMGVAFIFFVKSVIPTFLDLGVRETAAVVFFGVFSYNHQNIIFASLTLWLLNLVFPALLGLFLVYRIRVFNKQEEGLSER